MNKKLFLICDGASIGNGNSAGIGVIIKDENGKTIASVKNHIGRETNNVAKYQAVIAGLKKAKEMEAKKVVVLSDSNLIINQLKGEWKVKVNELKPYWQESKDLASKFDECLFDYVPREYTHEADALAREASEMGVEKETEKKYPFLNKF